MDFMLKIILLETISLAEQLKVPLQYVEALIERNELPAFKINGGWRVRASDLADWIDKRIAKERAEKDAREAKNMLDRAALGKKDDDAR